MVSWWKNSVWYTLRDIPQINAKFCHILAENGPLRGLKMTVNTAMEILHNMKKPVCQGKWNQWSIKKNTKTESEFKYDPSVFRDPGIEEYDSETKLYDIDSLNLVEPGE